MDTIRATNKELKFTNLLIQHYIPGKLESFESYIPGKLESFESYIPGNLESFESLPQFNLSLNFFLWLKIVSFSDECLEMIQEAAKYNESIDEWQLKYIAFTGNNIQKVRKCSLFLLSISFSSLPFLNLIFLSSFSQSHFSRC